jgi:exonuclease SbcC
MRPIRLELEGFTAFRERTEVCFDEGTDLFVLCGPTGSGKSSLIDAMSFALYGSVPRYEDPRLVHPVISQGLLEARVRFDFAVNGRAYTAVRVVRRTRGGATTREARLECGAQVLAGNVSELEQKVKELFGLSFEQFHTCVVLPQGEFARFLHETPAKRQDLLKELLGLREYERVGQLARQRDAQIRNEVIVLEKRCGDLAGATPAARSAARARLRDLRQLEKMIAAAKAEMEASQRQRDESMSAAAGHAERLKKLASLKVPGDAGTIGQDQVKAGADLKAAAERRGEAEAKCAEAEAACTGLPAAQPLRDLRQAHLDREAESQRRQAAEAAGSAARQALAAAQAALDAATQREASARSALDDAQRRHAAHHLAANLSPGDPCPVCLRAIDESPHHATPPELGRAEADCGTARLALADASRAAQQAGIKDAQASMTLTGIQERVAGLDKKLNGAPGREEIERQLSAIAESESRLAAARRAVQESRQIEQRAREAHERTEEQARVAWSDYDRCRDGLAALGPPPADRANLAGSWKALSGWAQATAAIEEQKAAAAKKAAHAAAEQLRAKAAEVAAACAAKAVDPGRDDPLHAVIRSITQAEQELTRIESEIARRDELEAQLKEARRRQAVAHTLAGHLTASGFERWLLREAFDRLVQGAGVRLRELSSGDYSLRMSDELNFEIIDHRNADEPRMVKTLSGGETFMASLALSLTLADQVAELAAAGTARLESVFLDEGFGTLDPEALDVVADTIEELASRGRTVGIVTHVPGLADRIPVQYRVSREPATSRVERVVL